jgi:hypothetical protein
LIADFFGPLRYVPLRTRKLMVVVVDLHLVGSNLWWWSLVCLAALFFRRVWWFGADLKAFMRSWCLVVSLVGLVVVVGGLCVAVVLAESLGAAVVIFCSPAE